MSQDAAQDGQVDPYGYGRFFKLCQQTGSGYSTLPVCNLFNPSYARGGNGYGGCQLEGINVGGGDRLANLGMWATDTRSERIQGLTAAQGLYCSPSLA